MINKNRITLATFLTCFITNILLTDLAVAAEREQRDFSSSDITKVLMLGTGTPVPNPEKRGTSIAVIVKGIPYIVDAGAGIWRAMGEEMPDVPMPGWQDRKPSKVKGFELHKAVWERVFLTHLHSDHTIGLPSLILLPWSWRREEPPHIYGPPGTKDLVDGILSAYRHDIAFRVYGDEANNDTGWRAVAHEIFKPGFVYKDENVKVSAFKTQHGTAPATFAYRFETPDRVIIISGDTGYRDEGYSDTNLDLGVLEAAKGVEVDILLHEVFGIDDLDSFPYEMSRAELYHTSTKKLAEIANIVKPSLLVMYHVQNFTDNPNQLLEEIEHYGWKGKAVDAQERDVY